MPMPLRNILCAALALFSMARIGVEAAVPSVRDRSSWQPYRAANVAVAAPEFSDWPIHQAVAQEAAAAAPPSIVEQAQWAAGQSVVCPQPMCAPACPTPMYITSPYAVGGYLPTSAPPPTDPTYWQWRALPDGVIWQSYWAGVHEPRMSGVVFADQNGNALLDVTLGGRAALVRYGTDGPGRPHGFELQIEGAATPRLNLDEQWDLDAADFRFGVPLVYGRDLWQAKFAYYHLSSHMGDEYAIRNDALADRINYSRDCLVLGLSYYPLPAIRLYSEAGWAFRDDVSEPWEFQFGVDVAQPGATGTIGTPFVAVNGQIREEVDFGGNFVFQAGWLWRGDSTNTLRLGFHYFNGKTNQFQFYRDFEQQIGGGLWYDF